MLKAARFGDQISHTQQRSGLIKGMIIGALIVGAVVLAVASGGTAIPALIAVGAVATGAAVGGGIGRLIGGENTVPKGNINKGATTVFVNSRATPAARSCIDTALCQDHALQLIATGSATVYIEKFPAARVSDSGACSFAISQGSPNVFIGGATGQCAGVEISPEVEPWLENLQMAMGLVGSFCLGYGALGWAGSALATAMGFGGSLLGSEIGGKYFGKWGAIAGGILGGIIGGGFGAGISRGLGRGGYRGFQPQPRQASFNNFANSVKEFKDGQNPALAREANDLYRQQKWGELEELMNKNGINGGYPPNNGFITSRNTTLRPGTRIDRYGGFLDENGNFIDKGQFLSPEGAPFGSRALPESSLTKPYRTYEVVKPIPNVQEGQAIPWFGREGMGTQYQLPGKTTVQDLIDNGFIRSKP